VADDIRSLSAALARDPASLQYVELAEALRRRGKLDEALQVATHGIGRHPEHADGYDCLARIHSDRGELLEARMAWERTLAIEPEHGGALKGVGFLFYRQGDVKRATDTLEHALAADPNDEAARRALDMIRGGTNSAQSSQSPQVEPRRKTPAEVPQLRATAAALRAAEIASAALEPPRREMASEPQASGPTSTPAPGLPPVFDGMDGATADILLLDSHGLVMAGGVKSSTGDDVSELAAAALAGVSGEASRTASYLNLGAWSAIVAEAEQANVVLSPVGEGALLMLRRDRGTPVGLAVRIAERAKAAAARWLELQG
jgi:predicted regulator of Ras-like GTPase activity (Roadblock/LC7/MglB family)